MKKPTSKQKIIHFLHKVKYLLFTGFYLFILVIIYSGFAKKYLSGTGWEYIAKQHIESLMPEEKSAVLDSLTKGHTIKFDRYFGAFEFYVTPYSIKGRSQMPIIDRVNKERIFQVDNFFLLKNSHDEWVWYNTWYLNSQRMNNPDFLSNLYLGNTTVFLDDFVGHSLAFIEMKDGGISFLNSDNNKKYIKFNHNDSILSMDRMIIPIFDYDREYYMREFILPDYICYDCPFFVVNGFYVYIYVINRNNELSLYDKIEINQEKIPREKFYFAKPLHSIILDDVVYIVTSGSSITETRMTTIEPNSAANKKYKFHYETFNFPVIINKNNQFLMRYDFVEFNQMKILYDYAGDTIKGFSPLLFVKGDFSTSLNYYFTQSTYEQLYYGDKFEAVLFTWTGDMPVDSTILRAYPLELKKVGDVFSPLDLTKKYLEIKLDARMRYCINEVGYNQSDKILICPDKIATSRDVVNNSYIYDRTNKKFMPLFTPEQKWSLSRFNDITIKILGDKIFVFANIGDLYSTLFSINAWNNQIKVLYQSKVNWTASNDIFIGSKTNPFVLGVLLALIFVIYFICIVIIGNLFPQRISLDFVENFEFWQYVPDFFKHKFEIITKNETNLKIRSDFMLILGIMFGIFGVVLFWAFSKNSETNITTNIYDQVRPLALLIFIETLAIFFLRQYRIIYNEYKRFVGLKLRFLNILGSMEMYKYVSNALPRGESLDKFLDILANEPINLNAKLETSADANSFIEGLGDLLKRYKQ